MSERPLKYLLDLNDSGTWGQDPTGEDDVPVLRSTDIQLDGSWRIHDPALRRVTGTDRVRKRLATGDIVVVKSSGSPEHLGKSAIVTEDVAAMGPYFANFVQRLRPSASTDSRYIWYVLNSKRAADEMTRLGNTTTGLRNLNGAIIGSVRIPVTRLCEQRAIADYLDTETNRIDSLITKKRRMIELLEQRLRITARELTTRSGETGPLRRFVRSVKTGTTPPAGELADLYGRDVAWYSPGDVGPNLRMHPPARSLNLRTLSEGWTPGFPTDSTLIVGIGATAGRVGHNVSRSTGNQQMTCITPNARILPRFLSWQLWARADELRETAPYTTLPILNNDFLRSISIMVPSLDMQESVVRRLDRSADLLLATDESLRTQISLLAERRQALITEAVTGEFAGPADR